MNTESQSSTSRPTFNELLDYAEGRLDGAGHKRVADYLAANPEAVSADWAWVQDFLNKARDVQLHRLPAGLEERLVRLYPATDGEKPMDKVSGLIESIRRVVAELVDAATMPDLAASGLRTKSFEKSIQQWIFKTTQFDILVNALVRPDQRYDLHGQVLSVTGGAAAKAGSAQLVSEGLECGLATVDDYGEFLIQGVPSGEYGLIIAGDDIEVLCSPVTFAA